MAFFARSRLMAMHFIRILGECSDEAKSRVTASQSTRFVIAALLQVFPQNGI
jgi:hypothetical protein